MKKLLLIILAAVLALSSCAVAESGKPEYDEKALNAWHETLFNEASSGAPGDAVYSALRAGDRFVSSGAAGENGTLRFDLKGGEGAPSVTVCDTYAVIDLSGVTGYRPDGLVSYERGKGKVSDPDEKRKELNDTFYVSFGGSRMPLDYLSKDGDIYTLWYCARFPAVKDVDFRIGTGDFSGADVPAWTVLYKEDSFVHSLPRAVSGDGSLTLCEYESGEKGKYFAGNLELSVSVSESGEVTAETRDTGGRGVPGVVFYPDRLVITAFDLAKPEVTVDGTDYVLKNMRDASFAYSGGTTFSQTWDLTYEEYSKKAEALSKLVKLEINGTPVALTSSDAFINVTNSGHKVTYTVFFEKSVDTGAVRNVKLKLDGLAAENG